MNLLFMHDDDLLTKPGTVRKLLDPTCGTGGMLSALMATQIPPPMATSNSPT